MLFKLFGVITLASVSFCASLSYAEESADVLSNPTDTADHATQAVGTFGPTERGTYLWRIAKEVRTEREPTTIYQWMYGIWIKNPDAFTDSNMHQLEDGKLLQIPALAEISAISQSLATETYSNHLNLLQPSTQTVNAVKTTQPEAHQASPAIVDPGLIKAKLKKSEIVKPTEKLSQNIISDKPSSDLKVAAIEPAVTRHKERIEMAVTNEIAMDVSLTQGLNQTGAVPVILLEDPAKVDSTSDLGQLFNIDKDSFLYLFTLDHLKNSYVINSGISWITVAVFFGIVLWKTNLSNRVREWVSGVSWNFSGFGNYAKRRSASGQYSPLPTSFKVSNFIDYLTVEDSTETQFELYGGSNHHIRLALSLAGIFASYGDIDKAIDLLQKTTEIQPENIRVKQRLLELYYKSLNLEDFKSLLIENKDDIHQLDQVDQLKLHSMHKELFPGSDPVFDLPSAKIRSEKKLKISRSSQNPNLQTSPGMDSFIDYLATEDHEESALDDGGSSNKARQAKTLGSQPDVIATYSDTDKAVDLLQQTAVVLHLLKIHHKAQNTEEFKSLVSKSKIELAELDADGKAKVQMMYSELFPNSDTIIEIPDSENNDTSGEIDNPAKESDSAAKLIFGDHFVGNLKEANAGSQHTGPGGEEIFDIMDILTKEAEGNDQCDISELDLSDKFPEIDEMIPQLATARIEERIGELLEIPDIALKAEAAPIETKNDLETKQENTPVAVIDEPAEMQANEPAMNLKDNHISGELLSVLSDMRDEIKKLNARLDQMNNS